tara:strand:- start:31663 stop:31854 length:192 start_codon:yes stop_codon:yes gene_type:complete
LISANKNFDFNISYASEWHIKNAFQPVNIFRLITFCHLILARISEEITCYDYPHQRTLPKINI